MKTAHPTITGSVGAVLAGLMFATSAYAQTIPESVTTPARIESLFGTLEFNDGQPSKETLEKVDDHLDFQHATRAFSDTLQGVGIYTARKGMQDAVTTSKRMRRCPRGLGLRLPKY